MLRPLIALLLGTGLLCGEPITRLACGSCYKPGRDSGIWKTIAAAKPQLFLFMGDNIYADTDDMAVMRAKYAALLKQPGYSALREQTRILPIWDDHDYGRNDAGADYPKREESQQIFLDTFAFPADHPARTTPGIYHSWTGGPAGKRLQIILLDTRYFRSPIEQKKINGRKTYLPNAKPDATLLGPAQWRWLESELRKPADLRFLVSSIQILATEHRFEKWSNFPAERRRLLELLKTTNTKRVVLFSGDRHLAELAALKPEESTLGYELVELTASGMTHAGASDYPNRFRIGPCWSRQNFGTIDIDWSGKIPSVDLAIRDKEGKIAHRHRVTFPK